MRVKPYGDKVPIPERAPHGPTGAGRLYIDVRVLLPVPLKPPNLVRRTGGNLLHGPVSLPGELTTQPLSEKHALSAATAAAMDTLRPHGHAGGHRKSRYHHHLRSRRQAVPPRWAYAPQIPPDS